MDRNKRITWTYLSITFIVLILTFVIAIHFRKNIGKKIQVNMGYAVGTYQYPISGGRPLHTDVYFSFEVKGEFLKRMPTKGKITGYKEAIEGNQYLVIYDTLNPKNCQILFDYPIKDSSDFKRYLEELKTKPLDFDKYF